MKIFDENILSMFEKLSIFKSIAILACFVFVLVAYSVSYNRTFLSSLKPFELLNDKNLSLISLITLNLSTSQCRPLFSSNKQYYANVNGEIYPKIVPLILNKSINFECLNKQTAPKIILMWNSFFGDKFYGHTEGNKGFIDNKCPVTNCYITADKNRLNEADMVVTHMRDGISEPPKGIRPEKQRWIFLLYESPIHANIPTKYNGFYNLTSTYLIGSDFPDFYSSNSLIWKKNSAFDVNKDYLSSKKNFAAAVISNCNVQSKRTKYINQMKKIVKVDVFGKCGVPCNPKATCKQDIAKNYKFYLSFENSICKDYITEKFFGILEYEIIPVVMGGGRYEKYVSTPLFILVFELLNEYFCFFVKIPKSGFINAKDFSSPEKLTEYMKHLSNNKTAYNSYFKWKKHIVYQKKKYGFLPICEMCIKLNLDKIYGVKQSIIKDITEYWSPRSSCSNNASRIVF